MPLTQPRPTRSRERDDRLLAEHAATRDPMLRARLVERYLPLARYAASRFAHGTEHFEDLLQVACIGLLHAIDRFDPARGSAFSSYALPTIDGELRRHLRDRGWSVRPPRDLQEHALRVERVAERLRTEHGGRAATVEELAQAANMTVESVLDARQALVARYAASLSGAGGGGGGDGDDDGLELIDRLGRPDDGFTLAEDRASLRTLFRGLTPREREIIRLRFWEDRTQAEIGAAVGLSQMHVSRLLRGALGKLMDAAADGPSVATA